MTDSFAADWLTLREPFDAAARSAALTARLIATLPANPHLIDLGAGTGSLFRWLAPRITGDQRWTFLEGDPALLDHARNEIWHWAIASGLHIGMDTDMIFVTAGKATWRIDLRQTDLADPTIIPLAGANAFVCSALLDLVSAPWLTHLAARLEVPMLACLSVDGRDIFLPRDPADTVVHAGFRRDQSRDKGFGHAVGPRAPSAFARIFAGSGFAVTTAASDWRISCRHPDMLTAMVTGHAEAALRGQPTYRRRITNWRAARLRQIAAGKLAIRIGHRDTLALPRED